MGNWNGLIIDPDERSRSHLKQLTTVEESFGQVRVCPDLYRAVQMLSGDPKVDLIYISHNIKSSERNSFFQTVKTLPAAKDAAIIQVADLDDADSIIEEAMNFLSGADGTLFTPFSVDDLVEVTRKALISRQLEQTEEQKKALYRLIKKILTNIDGTACSLAEIAPVARNLRELETSSRPVRELPEELYELYFETLMEASDESQVPEQLRPGAKYKSPNLKKKNGKRLKDFFDRLSF